MKHHCSWLFDTGCNESVPMTPLQIFFFQRRGGLVKGNGVERSLNLSKYERENGGYQVYPLLAPVGSCYHLLGPWEPLEGIRALCKIVMGGPQIDQNRGGSLFWSIYVLFEGPRQKSDRGSSKHSGSLLWSIWICRGPPPPLKIPILVNLVPPPLHWALLWSI